MSRAPNRLQARTAAAIAITLFLFLSLFFYTSYVSIRHSVLTRSDGEALIELRKIAAAIPASLALDSVQGILSRHGAIGESALEFVLLHRTDSGFETLKPLPNDIPASTLHQLEGRPGTVFSFSTPTEEMRMVSITQANFILGAAYNTIALEEAERSVIEVFGYYLVAGLFVAIASGIFLSRYLIGPINLLARSARNLLSHDRASLGKTYRLPVSTKVAEVAELARSINAVLDARDRALEHERNFAADAAHELRTPLTVLKGEIEVELRTADPAGSQAELLRSNLEEIERLIGTVQDLLELAEMEAGHPMQEEAGECSLHTALVYAAERLHPLAEARGIEIVLPEDDFVIAAQEERMTRLIYNLLLNAIQHSNRGTNIDVRLLQTKTLSMLEVEDHGEGIAAGETDFLFERFRRGESPLQPEGTGLGLAIAKSITDHYGFRLELRKNERGGTTARVTIGASGFSG